MSPEERRHKIFGVLAEAKSPVTGQSLSEILGVSRQVIVQDVAVLRARGRAIIATPRGYTLAYKPAKRTVSATVACFHTMQSVQTELFTIVRHGGEVLDVIVEHPLYGQITGLLMIKTEKDVNEFMRKVSETNAALLSSLTRGVHLHTITAKDTRSLATIISELGTQGFLVREDS